MAVAPPLGVDMTTAQRMVATPVLALLAFLATGSNAGAASNVVIVEGLGGNPQYTTEFGEQVDAISAAAATLSPAPTVRVFRSGDASRDAIVAYFSELATRMSDSDLLTVYLVGHGSYDDREYKFNIAGPDLTDADIVDAMGGVPGSNQVLVNTSSASGAGADLWADERRVVITATRSGSERHATRFGIRFAAALGNESADIDKNQIVSAQEAFDYAARSVKDYFEASGQLATEHPRLSGDQAGRIGLARLNAARPATGDSRLSDLVAARDEINGRIEALRLRRDALPADAYQQELLGVMLELAEAEEAIERREEVLTREQ